MNKLEKAGREKCKRWKALLAEHQSSGLTVGRFCEKHQLNKHTFNYWKQRLRSISSLQPPAEFREVRVVDESMPTSASLEIVVGSIVIRVPPGFDESHVRRLIMLVHELC